MAEESNVLMRAACCILELGERLVRSEEVLASARTQAEYHLEQRIRAEVRTAQVEAALVAVEFIRWNPDEYRCPFCRLLRYEGHAPDCLLGAALKGASS